MCANCVAFTQANARTTHGTGDRRDVQLGTMPIAFFTSAASAGGGGTGWSQHVPHSMLAAASVIVTAYVRLLPARGGDVHGQPHALALTPSAPRLADSLGRVAASTGGSRRRSDALRPPSRPPRPGAPPGASTPRGSLRSCPSPR